MRIPTIYDPPPVRPRTPPRPLMPVTGGERARLVARYAPLLRWSGVPFAWGEA